MKVDAAKVRDLGLLSVTGICQYPDCWKPAEDIVFTEPGKSGKTGCFCEEHKQLIEKAK